MRHAPPAPRPVTAGLTNEDLATPAATPLSSADIRHNLRMLVLIDSLWVFGAAEMLLAAGPLYVYLNASNTLIGAIGSLQMLGLLGIFLSPYITRRFPRKKYYLLAVHVPYLAPWGAIGLALLGSTYFHFSNAWLLTFIIVMNAISGLFAGFVTLPHHEYVAACIPMSHRGRLSGYSNTAGAALALLSNGLAGWILYHLAKPAAFGWLYVMTWVICQSGYILAVFGREQRTPVEHAPSPWSEAMLRATLSDTRYLRVIGLNIIYLLLFYPAITIFVAIYGFRELHMIPAAAATIGICHKAAQLVVGTKLGHWIDRHSPKKALLLLPFSVIAALLPIVLWPSPYAVYLSAAIGATFTVGFMASFNALLFGLPRPEHRAGAYTIQILCSYLAGGCGQLLLGAACDHFGYLTTFLLLLVAAAAVLPLSRALLRPLSEKPEHYS